MSIYVKPIEDLKQFLFGGETMDSKEQKRFRSVVAADPDKAVQALRVTALLKFEDAADEGDTAGGVDRLARPLPGICIWQAWVAISGSDGRRRLFTAHALTKKGAAAKLHDVVYYGFLEAACHKGSLGTGETAE